MNRTDYDAVGAEGDGASRHARAPGGYASNREYARGETKYGRENGKSEPGLGELFRELTLQAQRLVHLEVRLAKTELSEKIDSYAENSAFLVGGGLVAYAGFIGIMMALGFLLATFMPTWLGFLCAGVLVAIIGGLALQKGMSGMKSTQFSLEKTAESIEEDKEWIRGEASDVKKDPAHLGSHR